MRFSLSRFALALTLVALAPACVAQSYAVLLKNPVDTEDHVHITNSKGTFGINTPGYGTAIGKYIQTVHRYEPEQIKADFSYALEGMSSILAAGLPVLPHSYIALLEISQGPLGKVAFNSERGEVLLDKAGQGVLIDGYSDDPYEVGMQQIRKDFGPALASLDEIIKAGLHSGTYLVLLESPDGSVGEVIFTDARGTALLKEADHAIDIDPFIAADNQSFEVEEKQVKQDFGNALESRPILPAKYVLVFKSGSTSIAPESQEEADRMLQDISSRPAPDITISGHTDSVGNDKYNDKLSQKRAELIAGMIRNHGTELRALDIEYYGERKLLVQTADNKSEIRNRRVEITVR